ncbi:uncharacterized protein LOC123704145 [Colias croceus]|uniref:uncharacterized protein LOC123704145 n=1 Tax=Colias crocea TaxID=72248 RepID=UPI001E27DF03|nr:uncharacterized protein LOC123704145 [Colias croceus]
MECGEGMIAVVRGLKDSALAVTLLDGGKHYTLQPDVPPPTYVNNASGSQCAADVVRRESGVQATDGRYASTYKMMHCHVTPTSPHTEVTEFPPQRAELCPGQGNFEIGGPGSCEKYKATKSNSYKGGLCWPDKGAVFTSRPSVQPDAFASSLRKYPNMSPERSAEIMERFISYAQSRSITSKTKSPSPTRTIESDTSTFCLETLRNTNSKQYRSHEPDINLRNKRIEESPTRERSKKPLDSEVESWRRGTFGKTTDVRYLKDVTRVVRESIRSMAAYNQPEKLPRHESPSPERRTHAQKSCNSVNMEIQAAVQMVSREMVTSPKTKPSQRNVAISITPPPSAARSSGAVSFRSTDFVNFEPSSKSIQTRQTNINLKTISSFNNLRKRKRRNNRRSKSDEEIRLEINNTTHVNDGQKIDKLKGLRKAKCACKVSKNKNKTPTKRASFRIHENDSLDDLDNFDFKPYSEQAHVFHTQVKPYKAIDEDDLAVLLQDWLSIIPLKPANYFGRPIEKEYLFYDLLDKLKHTACHLPEHNRRDKIKEDIIGLLNEFPVDVKGNRDVYLGKLADVLIERIKNLGRDSNVNKRTINVNNFHDFTMHRYIPPTENELRTFISDELVSFIRKYGLVYRRHSLLELEEELVDVVMLFMENIHTTNNDLLGDDLINILIDYGFLDHQASHFVHILIKHLREAFLDDSNTTRQSKGEALVVLPSIQSQNPYTSVNANEYSISAINESDINSLMETYTRQLCEQINEWLTSIQTLLPRINERGFRQVVVNDLAGDIIDRHKYLEMNPGSRGTDEAELEHLKYQIFKWINKLAGEDTLQPGEHAPELMRRIRSIPVPMLTIPNNQPRIGNMNDLKTIEQFTGGTSNRDDTIQNSAVNTPKTTCTPPRSCGKETCSQNQSHGACCPDENLVPPASASTERLNDEYEQFVKNWVQKIPIRTSSPEEEALAEKARLGIHNGIWKALTKIRCDPSIYRERFYFEDVLDDEVEDLLNCLPQTPELQAKKHLLKVELIKRTIDTIEQNKAELARSFRQELIRNVDNSLQRQDLNTPSDSNSKAREELEIMRIVEQFILYSNYKDEDPLKSEVYRKRLLKEIKELIDEIKKNHSDQANINYTMYITDILNALHQVPLPGDDTIKEEANNILLEFEIEKWFTDLPIVLNEDDTIEILQWKRKLDNLTQKIRDLENSVSPADLRERSIRNEILKFLEKAPLQGENINKDFMAEQLVNRIKNRDQLNQSKRVAFNEPGSYDDFRSNVPLSSSYIEKPHPITPSSEQNQIRNSLALRNEGHQHSGTDINYDAFSQGRPKESTFKDRDESDISYQGFSGRQPLSSTFKIKPNQSFGQQESFRGNASDDHSHEGLDQKQPKSSKFKGHDESQISYREFSGRQPASAFKDKEEGFVSIPPAPPSFIQEASVGNHRDKTQAPLPTIHDESKAHDASDILSYQGFSNRRPISSTFKNKHDGYTIPVTSTNGKDSIQSTPSTPRRSLSQPRKERQSSDQYKTLKPTPKPSNKKIDRNTVDQSAQMSSERSGVVLECCKPHCELGNKERLSQEAGSSGLHIATPQPARYQKGQHSVSKGIIFKDRDDFSATPRLTPNDPIRGTSVECQTSGQAQEEVSDIHFSQDGNYRTIATNTPRKRILCLGDDIAKLLDVDNADDSEIRCRCIERFLRCKKQLRRFACDGIDADIPSCLPLMFTCPCFL